MKRRIFTTVALVCCFMICFAIAADTAGKWAGTLTAPDGNQYPLTYTFKTDSGKLTGTGSSPEGDVAITNGKLNGNDFTFTIGVGGVDIINTGKYYPTGDSIGLNIDYNGMKFHSTLKRAN